MHDVQVLLHILLTWPRGASTQHPLSAFPGTSSPVPLLCEWELSVAQTGNLMSLCAAYSLSTSLHPYQVDLVLSPCYVSEFDYLLLSSLLYQRYFFVVVNWVTTAVSLPPVLVFFILSGVLHDFQDKVRIK